MNRKNSILLSFLQSYLSEKYESTYYDEKGIEHFIFKIKDKYFDLYTIVGQGACTYVEIYHLQDNELIDPIVLM